MLSHFCSYPFSPCPASPCHILGSPCYGSGLTVTLHRQSQQGTSQIETFASRLVMAGVDLRTVQELTGHKTIQVTMRYADLAPAHQLEAVQRLCNTGSARSRAIDTRTDTMPHEMLATMGARPN